MSGISGRKFNGRRMSRQHFVEDNTDRVNIARRTGLRQAKLLRRRITDRAERQRIRLDLLPQLSGNIEINQLEFVSAQQNIGRLDVPMHDPPPVQSAGG